MLKAPPLQTATATIDTLCGRLQSATLLEDRRAAILGLRSFAKQYPASVASGSVRELIATLRRDGLGHKSTGEGGSGESGSGDVDTIRLVLETILMLFNPDSDSPEAGDEIAFFMADEFSVRQDNMLLLLSLLDSTSPYADYYSRKYSVDILSAICAARPERLQECILSAPLGISRLVSILDDGRDAVRNAGLLLLVDLTNGANEDLRKIVAFEDVFGKVFALIRLEGGLAEAGITAQDCLSLLANLIKGSSSNQTMFRESGCVALMTQLLREAAPPAVSEATFIAQSREKSAFGLLQLLRLFLVPGETSTPQNQTAFFRAGVAQVLIDLGFTAELPIPVRTVSLKCAAELITDNAALQEAFASMTVAVATNSDPQLSHKPLTNGTRSSTPAQRVPSARPSAERPRTYIIEALLDLTLEKSHDEHALRAAACSIIQAYLYKHERIRVHFLQRAISGHAQQEKAANVLTTLARPRSDPSGLVFASWIVQDLIAESLDAKVALANLKEDTEVEGEEVLSYIQTLSSQLQEALQHLTDERVIAAYASLLAVFLWDFAQGVDDFLAEGSGILQLFASTPKTPNMDPLIAGLTCVLLGIVYEFSTKDSPISRRTLAPVLTQKLTRSKYLDSLVQLRRHPAIRDFDLLESEDDGMVLCEAFVELFSVEYSRLRKAIDKDPGIEVLPPSTIEAGVDRDVLDDLRQQLQSTKDTLASAQEEGRAASQKYEQEILSTQKDRQTATSEVDRLRRINEAMQQGHEGELEKLSHQHERQKQDMTAQHQQAITTVQQETQHKVRQATQQTETSFHERIEDFERRIAELGNTHRAEQSRHAESQQQLEALRSKHDALSTREKSVSQDHTILTQQYTKVERDLQQLQTTHSQAQADLSRAQQDVQTRSADVDRLNAQLQELRDELRGKDEELSTERAGFADLETELEAAKKAQSEAQEKSKESAKSSAAGSGKLADVEKQLEEAKQEAQTAREELDSMLLVMGDIEAKRDEYRAKVKELGGEVSDGEDDEDSDDEGEEEDEKEEDGGDDADDVD